MPAISRYQTTEGPRWACQLKVKSADGKWRLRRWRGFASKYDAQRFLEEKRDDRYRQKYFPHDPKRYTVESYFQKWLHSYVKPHCKYSTGHGYELILKAYILPVIGHKQLEDVTSHDLTDLFDGLLQSGKSRQTLRNIIGPLREGLNHAVSDGLIPANPCHVLQRHFKRTSRSQFSITPLDPVQTCKLLHLAKQANPLLNAAVLLGVRAGLRAGEVLGLQWGDIDWSKKTILVQHALVRARITTPKNHQIRTVDLTASVIEALMAIKRGKPKERIIPYSLSHLQNQYYALLEQAGIPKIRFHDLRHSYASQLISAGANIKYIQHQMGHSSITVTMDIYGHLLGTERHVDRLDATP